MEVGDKLKELDMTVEEVHRLTKALKDEKFGEMLRDYARELSDPENKKRYEEEIKLLEQERGNTIEFIHPEPFRSLRTSVNGKQKCFINICASKHVGKPAVKSGVSEDGRRGQCWSLPHSLPPGRQDTDPKGNKIQIHDVIFHPDTVHMASKNKGFMDMVDSTAIQGIQKAFKVTLDKNNVREMSTKYKGAPQPCVLRKPIPGYKSKEPSEEPDPLAFPYPDDKRPTTSLQMKATKSAAAENSSDAEPKSDEPEKVKEPTKPNYTVKYRYFVDLQDFRYARDSAQSPRPKEIVVTIAMPLLKAASDASLEVKERQLLLVSEKPAYRLELPLAYPVDEDKGEAKFNKQRGQLTVTLSVLPSDEAYEFAAGSALASVSDDESQEEKREVDEEDECKEKERESKDSEEQRAVEEDVREQTRGVDKEGERGHEKGEERMREEEEGVAGEEETQEGKNSEEEKIGLREEAKWKKPKRKGQEVEEEILKEQKQENDKEVGKSNQQKRQQLEDNEDSGLGFQCGTVYVSVEEESSSPDDYNRLEATPETDNPLGLIPAEHLNCIEKEGGVNLNSCLESPPKVKTSDIREEKVEANASFLNHKSREESQTSTAAEPQSQNMKQDVRKNTDPDDSPKLQILHKPEHDNKLPPVLLREIDKDGNETIISDHSTSAGFIFQNSLMYELD